MLTANDMRDHKPKCYRKCPFCSDFFSSSLFDDHKMFCSKQWTTSDWKTEDSKNGQKWSDFDKKLAEMIVNNLRKTSLENSAPDQDEKSKFDTIFQENKLLTETSEKLRKQLTETINQRDQKFEDFNHKYNDLQQKFDDLQAECHKKSLLIEKSSCDTEVVKGKMNDLVAENERLTQKLKNSKEQVAEVYLKTQLLDQKDHVITNLTEENTRLCQSATESEQIQRDFSKRIGILETDNDEKVREKNRLQEKVDAIFQENKLLTETSEKLRKQLTEKEQKFQDFNHKYNDLQQKFDDFQAENHEKSMLIEKWSCDTEIVQGKMNDMVAENEKLAQELKNSKQQVAEVHLKNQLLDQNNQVITKLTEENKILRQNASESEKIQRDFSKRIGILGNEYDKKVRETNRLQENFNLLQNENESLTEKNAEKDKHIETLNSKIAEISKPRIHSKPSFLKKVSTKIKGGKKEAVNNNKGASGLENNLEQKLPKGPVPKLRNPKNIDTGRKFSSVGTASTITEPDMGELLIIIYWLI